VTRRVSNVGFTPAAPELRRQGLLGWLRCTIDGDLALDGIGLRRSQSGRLTFSWPAHRAVTGRLHHHIRPSTKKARATLEAELLEHLFPLIASGGTA
jgi:hypothetical protein